MNKSINLFPVLAATGLALSCSSDPPPGEFEAPEGTDVRISAAVQADIEGLAGVSLELNPTMVCEGRWDDAEAEGFTPWTDVLDIDRMVWPDGELSVEASGDYTELLAETAFVDVAPGCYDLVARPLGADGEPLSSCVAPTTSLDVQEHASMVFSPQILCGDTPRRSLTPAELDANLAPQIEGLKVEPMVSPCEVVTLCATARDADFDMLEFAWSQPIGLEQGPSSTPWPTIVQHTFNQDRSVTQCIAIQAHEPGVYDVMVNVFDVFRPTAAEPPIRIEEMYGGLSSASEMVQLDATLGCKSAGRSAVILMTLDNEPGIGEAAAATLIDNTVSWMSEGADLDPTVLVVLDDNHRGEDRDEGEFVHQQLLDAGYTADYMVEPTTGLNVDKLNQAYSVVWFVNPGYEMDDVVSHTALLRFRQLGGGVIFQGDDISRFRANPQFMEPLTYLSYRGNGTVACGDSIDDNIGEAYRVMFEDEVTHPIIAGLEGQSFSYGDDIDLTVPLDKGEQVLAWASYESPGCVVRTPAIVALDPDLLSPW